MRLVSEKSKDLRSLPCGPSLATLERGEKPHNLRAYLSPQELLLGPGIQGAPRGKRELMENPGACVAKLLDTRPRKVDYFFP